MISYRFVPISSQKGVLFLRHPVYRYFFLFLVDQAVNKLLLSPVIHLKEIITYIHTHTYIH